MQEKNWRTDSPAGKQSETERFVDAETALEQSRFVEEADDSTLKNHFPAFSSSQFSIKNRGIIDISAVVTEAEKSEINSKFSAASKIGSSNEMIFFPANDERRFFLHQSKIDLKTENFTSVSENSPTSNKSNKNKDVSDDSKTLDVRNGQDAEGFRWRPAIQQALLFLAVQHGYAFTQPKTREALKGRFFHDYVKSVKSLHGWDDGGRFFTNYLAHPMQGSFVGFIQIQNDPKGMKQRFGTSGDYWRSRMKAMAWSAAWSTQFEIGPISQASIGNVGLKGKQTWEDIIITPTVGTAMLISEDALDRFVIERIERGTNNFYLRIFSRMLLNPTRTVANLIRFKHPWYRDRSIAK